MNGAQMDACTPMIFTFGRWCLIASAVPASRPPPPRGTMSSSRSPMSSSSSRPSVPWPAITPGSS